MEGGSSSQSGGMYFGKAVCSRNIANFVKTSLPKPSDSTHSFNDHRLADHHEAPLPHNETCELTDDI
ncbi:hypothetical protein CSHISOI_09807 [Colletotrichum shisoi]|uniref:Uncharacterized protein n=1 Tax=Colletotrichum shisoi TaxID=2078593 RepID=A0A5Q4BFS5_9PEZI|nr:hypothetical protein CSHISOI_09807 [Colletotrichum shisoi]